MSNFEINGRTEGIVTSIKKYGVFLSFDDNYIGLLHISEVSYSFVSNLYNYFKVGDKVTVIIKSIDNATKYLKVSIKDLPTELNPFKSIENCKRITNYVNNIDFTKLEKTLPHMIEEELKREGENENDQS